jgi:hypothetical protein
MTSTVTNAEAASFLVDQQGLDCDDEERAELAATLGAMHAWGASFDPILSAFGPS